MQRVVRVGTFINDCFADYDLSYIGQGQVVRLLRQHVSVEPNHMSPLRNQMPKYPSNEKLLLMQVRPFRIPEK